MQQVTHWDMDYLPKDEILNLYERETADHGQKQETVRATRKNRQKLPLLLIVMGLILLAASLFVASLI